MNFIAKLLAWLLPSSSVDKIVILVSKLVVQLEAAEQASKTKADKAAEASVKFAGISTTATQEAERAARIADNLKALIS